jgi:hypothetical protein
MEEIEDFLRKSNFFRNPISAAFEHPVGALARTILHMFHEQHFGSQQVLSW